MPDDPKPTVCDAAPGDLDAGAADCSGAQDDAEAKVADDAEDDRHMEDTVDVEAE